MSKTVATRVRLLDDTDLDDYDQGSKSELNVLSEHSNEIEDDELSTKDPNKIKRCLRCKMFYTDAANNNVDCTHHPGTFVEFSIVKGTAWGYTCCRPKKQYTASTMELFNDAAYKKNSKGCQHFEKHIEDRAYSASVASFPVYEEEAKKLSSVSDGKKLLNIPEDKVIETRTEPIFHKVEKRDTLAGLALKYGISQQNLKRVNHLTNNNIFHLNKILIPQNNDPETINALMAEKVQQKDGVKTAAIKRFREETKCELDLAKFYLEGTNYNVETALQEWKLDEAQIPEQRKIFAYLQERDKSKK